MRLIIQRVLEAGVKVDGEFISKIGPGICILLGLHKGDNYELVDKWAEKALKLKLWPEIEKLTPEQKESNNPKGKGGWKTSVLDNNYDVLVVSNFTLYGILNGNKPDFHSSMNADEARNLYNRFLEKMQSHHIKEKVQGGQFQTYMNVHIVNDGPVTLCIDADETNDVKQNQQKQKEQQSKKQENNQQDHEKKEKYERKQKPQGEQQQQQQQQQGDVKQKSQGGEHKQKHQGEQKQKQQGEHKQKQQQGEHNQKQQGEQKQKLQGEQKQKPQGEQKQKPQGEQKQKPQGEQKQKSQGDQKQKPQGEHTQQKQKPQVIYEEKIQDTTEKVDKVQDTPENVEKVEEKKPEEKQQE